MPSATPSVREQIVAAIAATLADLDMGGVPAQVIQAVHRDWRSVETEIDMPFAAVIDASETKVTGADGAPLQHYKASLDVAVWVIMEVGDARDEEVSQTLARCLAEAEFVIQAAAVPDSGTLKAISGFNWLHLTGNEFFQFGEGGDVAALRLDLEVQYIHRDTSPFLGRA